MGTAGWLFSREEFKGRPDEGHALQRDVEVIGAAHATLRARDVELLVVLVPAKAQVYRSWLGRWRLPGYVEARYDTVHQALRDRGIPVVDGRAVLSDAPADERTFFRTDTHWTPAGAARIADAAARAADAADVAPAEGEPYRTVEGALEPLEGDLLPFLALGPWQEALGPAPETLQRHDTRPVEHDAEGDGLFGAASIPVVLIGTSYSADPRWNFAGALREAFSNDVLNLAAEGEGPRAPMRAALNGEEIHDVAAELVVWEIPIRYLGADTPHD